MCAGSGQARPSAGGSIGTSLAAADASAAAFATVPTMCVAKTARDELNRQPFRFFLSAAHKERWTHWKNRCYGMSERNAAALFLLTADEEFWQRVLGSLRSAKLLEFKQKIPTAKAAVGMIESDCTS